MNSNITSLVNQLKPILDDALYLGGRTKTWGNQMNLLGNVPELDSIAVINVVVALENYFGIEIEDDDINADVFASLESIANFVSCKLNFLRPLKIKVS